MWITKRGNSYTILEKAVTFAALWKFYNYINNISNDTQAANYQPFAKDSVN